MRLSVRLVIIRRLGGDLIEHLVESHVDDWVSLDEVLEVFNDWQQRKLVLGDCIDLLRKPSLQDAVVDWQPPAKAMGDEDWGFARFIVVAHAWFWREMRTYGYSKGTSAYLSTLEDSGISSRRSLEPSSPVGRRFIKHSRRHMTRTRCCFIMLRLETTTKMHRRSIGEDPPADITDIGEWKSAYGARKLPTPAMHSYTNNHNARAARQSCRREGA